MPQRHIVRIELTGPAKQKLAAASDRHGMTQVSMMSRLVEWYSMQERPIQGAVMCPPGIQIDVAKLLIERMASNPK